MSIDKQVFVELVGELETYYKREFTPFVKRVWYKHLSDCLTTVEFQSAVELNGCPRIYADAAATRRTPASSNGTENRAKARKLTNIKF